MSKINIRRMCNYLQDSFRAQGDVVMVGGNNFEVFRELVKRSNLNDRTPYVLHELQLEAHLNQASDEIPWKSNELPDTICFAFIDEDDPSKMQEVLENILPKMSYGSTLFFKIYDNRAIRPYEKIVKRFLTRFKSELTSARQMLVDGWREPSLAVKYFPRALRSIPEPYHGKITIASVLKLGGDYDVKYVNALANGVTKNLTVPYEFVCLTDCVEGFNTNVHRIIPLSHNFQSWWSKIELFAPDKFNTERVFFLDLDTIITSNINDIATYSGNFFGLRDFFNQMGLGSGLMAWRSSDPIMSQIYEKFMESPTAHMNNHRMGDQEFINNTLGNYIEYVQDLYPNRIYSYKKDCVDAYKNIKVPEEASIVCFHGKPRPHQVNDPEIVQYFQP